MPVGRGVTKESPPQFVHGLWVDGEWFEDAKALPVAGFDYSPGGTLIPMAPGTTLLQLRWLAGDAPMCLEPTRWNVSFTVRSLAAQRLFEERARFGVAVPFYFDVEMSDLWYIPGRNAGQTLWKCSRLLPYGRVPNVTHLTRPPAVLVDGAALTVVAGTSGSSTLPPVEVPAAGQAVVPAYSPNGVGGIVTRSDLAGTRLLLRYHPVILGKIQNVRFLYPTVNGLRYSCEVNEHLCGIYNA